MITTYLFDELKLPAFGEGVLFYGKATLATNDEDTFLVKSITLDSGVVLERPMANGERCDNLSQSLFKAIRDVLYDEKTRDGQHAALEWAAALEEARQPDPDMMREQRRDDAAYFGSETARLERHYSALEERV